MRTNHNNGINHIRKESPSSSWRSRSHFKVYNWVCLHIEVSNSVCPHLKREYCTIPHSGVMSKFLISIKQRAPRGQQDGGHPAERGETGSWGDEHFSSFPYPLFCLYHFPTVRVGFPIFLTVVTHKCRWNYTLERRTADGFKMRCICTIFRPKKFLPCMNHIYRNKLWASSGH